MQAKGKHSQLIPFSKDRQPSPEKRRGGRRPSKVKKYIKDNNISSADISAMAKYMIPLTQKQLQDLFRDETQPFLMRVFAKAMVEDMKDGKIDNILKILDRAVGKQIDTVIQQHNSVSINYNKMSDEELQNELNTLTKLKIAK